MILQEAGESACSSRNQELMPHGWFGFKIVGDNIDKNVRPRHQTIDTRTQSLHYFHAFAILDRVDLSSQSEIRPDINLHEFDLQMLLPIPEDVLKLKSNFQIHIS